MLTDVDISSSNHSSVWETVYVSIRSRMVKLNMAHMHFRILGGIKRVRWIYICSHWKDPAFVLSSDKGRRQNNMYTVIYPY